MDPVQQSHYPRLLPSEYRKKSLVLEGNTAGVGASSYFFGRRSYAKPTDDLRFPGPAGYSREMSHPEPPLASPLLKNSTAPSNRLPHLATSAPEFLYSPSAAGMYLHLPQQSFQHLSTQQLYPSHLNPVPSAPATGYPVTSNGVYPSDPVGASSYAGGTVILLPGHRPSMSGPLRPPNVSAYSEGSTYTIHDSNLDLMSRQAEMAARYPQNIPYTLQTNLPPGQQPNADVHQAFYPSFNQSNQMLGASYQYPPSLLQMDFDLSPHQQKTIQSSGNPNIVAQHQAHVNSKVVARPMPERDGMGTGPSLTPVNAMNSLLIHGTPEKSQKREVSISSAPPASAKNFDFVMVNSWATPSSAAAVAQTDESPERNIRKRFRHRIADDVERHLKSLLPLAAGCTFEDLASRMKLLDGNDPVFGPLCNPKDIRMERPLLLFSLIWLDRHCEVSYSSVITRTRVYARYVDTCANQKLVPLMPTNFGKLVRVLYPNLTVRRLGMRGKSKYYYSGLKLVGDPEKNTSPLSPNSADVAESPHTEQTQSPFEKDTLEPTTPTCTSYDLSNVNRHFNMIELRYIPGLFSMIENSVNSETMGQPLDLPSIYSYLPEDMDVDYGIVEVLQTKYKAHLNSIFELIRYMQAEKLFELYSTLLADVEPAGKLLEDEALVAWVKDCDLVMYRAAVKMLARLYLQNVPTTILEPLNKLAMDLTPRISELLLNQFPAHLAKAKLNLAGQFVELLTRLLRCIECGSRIASILSNPSEKVVMLDDWLLLDIPDIIMRELPCDSANIEILTEILDTQLVKLLEDTTPSRTSVMAKYSDFLFSIPEKFPHASPWLFLLLASNVLTTCIREMTLAGSRSFKSWWILRCWVDEFIKWSMELGGYLYDDHKPQFQPIVKTEAFEGPIDFNNSFPQVLTNQDSNNYVDLLEYFDNGGLDWI